MRIITVEEHFEHPEVSARVLQLGGPPQMHAIGHANVEALLRI